MVYFMSIYMALLVSTGSPYQNKLSEERNETMYNGIMALSKGKSYITPIIAKKLLNEAVRASEGISWLSPELLLGLAYNESDLRWWLATGRGSYLDCGICQNHVPLFEKSYYGRIKLCRKLQRSSYLSFKYAVTELKMIKQKYCRHKPPKRRVNESDKTYNYRYSRYEKNFYMCLFNVYNQGPRFLRAKWRYCRLDNKRKRNYCLFRNNYWVRGICFAKAFQYGRAPSRTCRKAYSLRWVEKSYDNR